MVDKSSENVSATRRAAHQHGRGVRQAVKNTDANGKYHGAFGRRCSKFPVGEVEGQYEVLKNKTESGEEYNVKKILYGIPPVENEKGNEDHGNIDNEKGVSRADTQKVLHHGGKSVYPRRCEIVWINEYNRHKGIYTGNKTYENISRPWKFF